MRGTRHVGATAEEGLADHARLGEVARVDSTLTVADSEALLAAVRAGIGPAKTYGFGLLSLAPV